MGGAFQHRAARDGNRPVTFTDNDLVALEQHLVNKVEHGWTMYKLEGLITRMKASEKTMIELLILCDSAENKEAIMEATLPWRRITGREL